MCEILAHAPAFTEYFFGGGSDVGSSAEAQKSLGCAPRNRKSASANWRPGVKDWEAYSANSVFVAIRFDSNANWYASSPVGL